VDEAVRIWRSMGDIEVAEVPQALFNLAQLLRSGEEQTKLYSKAREQYAARIKEGEVERYGSGLGFMLVDGLVFSGALVESTSVSRVCRTATSRMMPFLCLIVAGRRTDCCASEESELRGRLIKDLLA
jgi:hypothetical protein